MFISVFLFFFVTFATEDLKDCLFTPIQNTTFQLNLFLYKTCICPLVMSSFIIFQFSPKTTKYRVHLADNMK